MLHSKNGTLTVKGSEMPYIRFGSGKRHLIMLPGLGDGLASVAGKALPMAWMYRSLAKAYTVWMFSRRRPLPEGTSTADMAADLAQAMEQLGIEKADVIGVSMGGMIAQHLAADYPEWVGKLVLTVTSHRPNEILEGSVREWMELAEKGDHRELMRSNLKRIYSEEYCRKNGWLVPLAAALTRPKSYGNFLIQGAACLTHDASDKLSSITARTLIVGGEKDLALGGEASREMALLIPDSRLLLYPQWGHGLYEEEPAFLKEVLRFLQEEHR